MPVSARQIKCPRCRQLTEYSENQPYRPFCSERCQMIDFGSWAEGKYTVPVEDSPSSSDGSERGEGAASEDGDDGDASSSRDDDEDASSARGDDEDASSARGDDGGGSDRGRQNLH